MHHRRARPTLRLLREDLPSGWIEVGPQRALADGRLAELHPLSELPHPIVEKAASTFGADAANDNPVGLIACSTQIRLLEIRQSQWRGGIWVDPQSGVCWLIAAGLAKGGHDDHDDFYKRVERATRAGRIETWLPTEDDTRLLNQETAARLRTELELRTQQDALDALREIHDGGSRRFRVMHPISKMGLLATFEITVNQVRENGYEADEVVVEVFPESRFAGSDLLWQMITRVLISLEPPEQGWDRYRDTYSNIGEPGSWGQRVRVLEVMTSSGELAVSVPGTTSHRAHRKHLAGKTIAGEAVRALCGAFFVPRQDHMSMPPCPKCEDLLAHL